MSLEISITNRRDDDYNKLIVEDEKRTEAICQFVTELVERGKLPGIVFARTYRHVQLLAERLSQLLDREVPQVTTKAMSDAERTELAERMREEPLCVPVAVATTVWSAGVDIPSLRWVLMAGGGQAPIGLKQESGRALRNDEGKLDYEIYDWQDVGAGAEAYQAQGLKRLKHYEDAGFAVERVRPDDSELRDEDASLLAELLETDILLPPPEKPVVTQGPVPAAEVWRAMDMDSRKGVLAFALVAAVLLLFVMAFVGRACL